MTLQPLDTTGHGILSGDDYIYDCDIYVCDMIPHMRSRLRWYIACLVTIE